MSEAYDPSEVPKTIARQELSTSTDLVRVYLAQIGRAPLLTAEQEVEHSRNIEAGLFAGHILAAGETESPEVLEETAARTETDDPKQPLTIENVIARHALEIVQQPAAEQEQLKSDYSLLVTEGEKSNQVMMESNLRLVVSVAKRYTGHGMPFLDLIQEGNSGLVRAVEKFDFSKGFKFSTYATWWIRQAITRSMAEQGKTIRLPVHLVENINKVRRAKNRMIAELDREPTEEEIGLELDMTEERIVELLSLDRNPISLDQTIDNGAGHRFEATRMGDFVEDVDAIDPVDAAVHAMMTDDVEAMLKTLGEREADVIRIRFGIGGQKIMTLDEIGKMYGLSRERVRQIERTALEKLRQPSRNKRLDGYL